MKERKIKTVYYYLGWIMEGIRLSLADANRSRVQAGDTAFIPAGEKHWHGAADGHDFSHISLTRPDSQTEMFKPES